MGSRSQLSLGLNESCSQVKQNNSQENQRNYRFFGDQAFSPRSATSIVSVKIRIFSINMRAIIIYIVRFFFSGPFLFIYHLFHIYIFWNKIPKSKFCKLQPRMIKTEKKLIKFMIFFFYPQSRILHHISWNNNFHQLT